jgi:hypothetical protein
LCVCVDRYRCILAASAENINIRDEGHGCEDLQAVVLELHLGAIQRSEEDRILKVMEGESKSEDVGTLHIERKVNLADSGVMNDVELAVGLLEFSRDLWNQCIQVGEYAELDGPS